MQTKEEKFEILEDKIANINCTIEGYKAVQRYFDGDAVKCREFFTWRMARERETLSSIFPQLTATQCLEKIELTNFVDDGARADWHWMMESIFKQFHIIGFATHGGHTTGYGIEPGPAYLLPHDYEPTTHGRGSRLHHSILGININVSGDPREMDTNSFENMQAPGPSEVSQDMPNGFVFAQLGALWAYDGDKEWAETLEMTPEDRNRAHKEGPWRQTGFGVVVRIKADGTTGEVFVIYNFWAHGQSQEPDDFHRISVKDSHGNIHPHIGRPHSECDPDDNFIGAMIADNMAQLVYASETTGFDFNVLSKDESHICPVRKVELKGKQYLTREYIKIFNV
ncbi:hypothetical protein K4K51_007462 [Colletotrichum sp. SAR 10_75]|nr:hypothetical protein K4K51_007462 [Colletotrichum sp. SAR 10_75]